MNGNKYNNKQISGKILVFNFWFIGCVACVKEMPALNKLVSEYKNREDIIFINVAFDKEKELNEFLKKTRFDYIVVSDTLSQMVKAINIQIFPTHIIVDKKGKVVKILNGYRNDLLDKLEATLKRESL